MSQTIPFDLKKELEINPPQKIAIDINQIPEYKCSSCGGTIFNQHGIKLKIVPATISRTGKPDHLVAKTFYCVKCRKEIKELTGYYMSLTEQIKKMLVSEIKTTEEKRIIS